MAVWLKLQKQLIAGSVSFVHGVVFPDVLPTWRLKLHGKRGVSENTVLFTPLLGFATSLGQVQLFDHLSEGIVVPSS